MQRDFEGGVYWDEYAEMCGEILRKYGTCKYKILCRDRDQSRLKRPWKLVEIHVDANEKLYGERPKELEMHVHANTKETKETVETRDACKCKIVWSDRG